MTKPDLIARLRDRPNDAPMETEHLLDEAADEIDRLRAELDRRDRNETRNCINWGPCSAHDGSMADTTLPENHHGR